MALKSVGSGKSSVIDGLTYECVLVAVEHHCSDLDCRVQQVVLAGVHHRPNLKCCDHVLKKGKGGRWYLDDYRNISPKHRINNCGQVPDGASVLSC